MKFSRNSLASIAVAALAIVGAACSSSPPVAAPAAPVVAESAPVAAESAPSEQASTEQASLDAAPVEPETGSGTVDISFDDGRSWTLATTDCYTEPESAFGIFVMSGEAENGANLNVVESWPLDGDRSGGTAFIATFTDEMGDLFVIDGGPVQDESGRLTFASPVYEGFSSEATIQGVFSCTP